MLIKYIIQNMHCKGKLYKIQISTYNRVEFFKLSTIHRLIVERYFFQHKEYYAAIICSYLFFVARENNKMNKHNMSKIRYRLLFNC